MTVYPLDEGIYSVSKQKVFERLPGGGESEDFRGLRIGVRPFLVEMDEELILLDCGLGTCVGESPIIENLIKKEGFTLSDITMVLVSHLHKDHTDGLGEIVDGIFRSYFPNAKIYLQQRELDFALGQADHPSYNTPLIVALAAHQGIVFLNDDCGEITLGVSYMVSGGHTPYHQVFWLRENGETVFYPADELPQARYLHPHMALKTDFDGKRGMLLRQEWEKHLEQSPWFVLLYHDLEAAMIRL